MKTIKLTGAILDYWVAVAEGFEAEIKNPIQGSHERCWTLDEEGRSGFGWNPSTSWAQGGPLIEKYTVTPYPSPFGGWDGYNRPQMHMQESRSATPLEAICRAVVRAKFGDEVEDVGR